MTPQTHLLRQFVNSIRYRNVLERETIRCEQNARGVELRNLASLNNNVGKVFDLIPTDNAVVNGKKQCAALLLGGFALITTTSDAFLIMLSSSSRPFQ